MSIDKSVLRLNGLFSEMNDEDIDFALDFFDYRKKFYKKGELLHRFGEPLECFGIVLSGVVQVFTDDINGNQVMMASAEKGGSFGDSLCYLKIPAAPVYIYAATDCYILWLSAEKLHDIPISRQENELHDRFAKTLAARALSMNRRIQILSKHSLREKLLTFFTDYIRQFGTEQFSIPFDRSALASYLGADRSAVSRELANMKNEGLIDFEKNTFRFIHLPQDLD